MSRIQQRLFQGKAIILLGPRQSGKTTLIKAILEHSGENYLMLNADEPDVRELLQNTTSTRLKTIIKGNRIVCIDEAQRIPNIGITLPPLSFSELASYHGLLEERRFLEHRMVYGSYPEVVASSPSRLQP